MGIFTSLMSKFHERGKAKAEAKKQEKSKTGPKEPPASVQLPGGVVIRAFPFRITSTDAQGRPLTFERARGNEDQDCVLWGTDEFLDGKLAAHLDQRYRKRIEDSIEGLDPPDLVKSSRTYGNGYRAPGAVLTNPNDVDALKEKLASNPEKYGLVGIDYGREYPDPERNTDDE